MKKFVHIVCCIVGLLLLGSCSGKKEETMKFRLVEEEMTIETEYYYRGDEVLSQIITTKIPYKKLDIADEQEAHVLAETLKSVYDGIEGVECNHDCLEKELVQSTVIDFSVVDQKKLVELGQLDKEGEMVSMKKTESWHLSSGYKKVE